jgi:hypothetical protein
MNKQTWPATVTDTRATRSHWQRRFPCPYVQPPNEGLSTYFMNELVPHNIPD